MNKEQDLTKSPPDQLLPLFTEELNHRIGVRKRPIVLSMEYAEAWTLLTLLQSSLRYLEANTSTHDAGWTVHRRLMKQLKPGTAMKETLRRGLAA
jgi:hypothetical protein